MTNDTVSNLRYIGGMPDPTTFITRTLQLDLHHIPLAVASGVSDMSPLIAAEHDHGIILICLDRVELEAAGLYAMSKPWDVLAKLWSEAWKYECQYIHLYDGGPILPHLDVFEW